jgi:hypothetical protein
MAHSQSTETDDTDLLAWSSTVSDQRREDGQSTTQHGSGVGGRQFLGEGEDESLLRSNVGRVTALVLRLIGPEGVVAVNGVRAVVLCIMSGSDSH